MSASKKVELILAQDPEAEEIAALVEQLTGRKPSPEEMQEVAQTLAELETSEDAAGKA